MSPNKTNEEQIIRTICNSHCGGICEMKVHVSRGRIVRIESGGEGETSHRMCARGRAYRQRVYAPDRLLHPLLGKMVGSIPGTPPRSTQRATSPLSIGLLM